MRTSDSVKEREREGEKGGVHTVKINDSYYLFLSLQQTKRSQGQQSVDWFVPGGDDNRPLVETRLVVVAVHALTQCATNTRRYQYLSMACVP